MEECERNTIARRITDAHLPRMKPLNVFDFDKVPQVLATKMHALALGGYIERAEPILLIGDCGTDVSSQIGAVANLLLALRLFSRQLFPLS
jgi:DNA replication protein DnaC